MYFEVRNPERKGSGLGLALIPEFTRKVRRKRRNHTTWYKVFEELIAVQSAKKFPAFHGTRRFITVYTRARHWTLQ
jgi:hypothetical protein